MTDGAMTDGAATGGAMTGGAATDGAMTGVPPRSIRPGGARRPAVAHRGSTGSGSLEAAPARPPVHGGATGGSSGEPPRTMALWCPDWPVVAAARAARQAEAAQLRGRRSASPAGRGGMTPGGARPDAALTGRAQTGRAQTDRTQPSLPAGPNLEDDEAPVAVLVANRVVACSQAARASGVTRGMRRREAQSRCPELVMLARDEMAEARIFEPIAAAMESLAPGVEVTRPGLAAVAARGPSRYFGGEEAAAAMLARAIGEHAPNALIGIADGAFAAEQAARRGVVVPSGESARFLAPMPVAVLGDPELADLLRRLGIRTLGQFAQLPSRDVLARFGPTGALAHRRARARDARPIAARAPGIDFVATIDFDPPLDRVDAIAFSARTIAEEFIAALAAHGLACTCLELSLLTDNGEEAARRWRHTGVLGTLDVLDRIRWQLEGWLHGRHGARDHGDGPGADPPPRARPAGPAAPTSGVVRLRLAPIETAPTGTHQQALWGGSGEQDERAHRALARVQTLLGHGSVVTAVRAGGRDPLQRTQLVPWGDERIAEAAPDEPWPGALPAPAPAVLLDPPAPARVLDETGRPVRVTERGAVPMPPARLAVGSAPAAAVTGWAGPWPVDERWWPGAQDPGAQGPGAQGPGAQGPGDLARRRYRFQLVDVQGRAYLALYVPGDPGAPAQWSIEGVYD